VARVPAIVAALLVAACAGMEFRHPPPELEFELTGRIAVAYRDEASSGHLAWRHGARGDEMLVTSSLGQTVARLVREGEQFVLTTAEARQHRAGDVETLTEQVLGFRVPLAGLASWVRARPADGPFEARRDESGRLRELAQAGWRIEYLEYRDALPSRLRLTYPGLELRLAIGEWK
jgi:outer membrane lipoprotein LolB